uniref:Putative secreted protein n=1 Tax=Ixodes ricinus TaxID=34613 RepID=A0A6B0U9Z3_IXORI
MASAWRAGLSTGFSVTGDSLAASWASLRSRAIVSSRSFCARISLATILSSALCFSWRVSTSCGEGDAGISSSTTGEAEYCTTAGMSSSTTGGATDCAVTGVA